MEGRIGSTEEETLKTDLEHIFEAMRRPLGGREEVMRPQDRPVRNRRRRRVSSGHPETFNFGSPHLTLAFRKCFNVVGVSHSLQAGYPLRQPPSRIYTHHV